MTPTLSSAMPALETDRDIWAAIRAEGARQEQQLELIASENHASAEVIAAMGTVLTNKYAEGYPGKRYYGGCEHVDVVERIARERCQALFGAPYANVQPHSGTQATIGALMAVAQPGDEILAMSLDHGGHLSHGHPKNASGIFFHFAHYGLNPKTERIDMDQVREQALALRPKVIVAGGSAYPRLIDFAAFAAISKEVGAKLLVDMAHIAGLVAGGVHASPVGHADVIASSTHKTLRGPRGGFILMSEGTNKGVNSAVFPGGQGGPLMHVIAAKAIAFKEAQQDSFKAYARNVVQNAKALAETLVEQGLRLVSGGTDNHLMLVDVSSVGLTGDVAENLLHAVDITCNKNLIPFDQQPPMKTSGIRLGTPAVTTRGLNVEEARQLGRWIAEVLRNPSDTSLHQRVRGEVGSLCRRRRIYPA